MANVLRGLGVITPPVHCQAVADPKRFFKSLMPRTNLNAKLDFVLRRIEEAMQLARFDKVELPRLQEDLSPAC